MSPLGGLGEVPAGVLGLFDDIKLIARSTQALPEVVELLKNICRRVDSLDAEVAAMRAAVDEIEEEVRGVRESTAPLAAEIAVLRSDLSGLEPHLAEVRGVVAPLQIAAERLGSFADRFPGKRGTRVNGPG